MTIVANQIMLYDRSLKVKVVRPIAEGKVIVLVGSDTRVVDEVSLSPYEA